MCFQRPAKPYSFLTARCNRSFSGLGGEKAATCIGRRRSLMSVSDVNGRVLNARLACSNEVMAFQRMDDVPICQAALCYFAN